MAVRIERIFCTVLNEAHEQQAEETMNTSQRGRGAPLYATDICLLNGDAPLLAHHQCSPR
jgi:hypothetical protein